MHPEATTRPTRDRVCVICARAFVVSRPSTVQPCCSRACAAIARTGVIRYPVSRVCVRCGRTYVINRSTAKTRPAVGFCGRACRTAEPRQVVLRCEGCGVVFSAPLSQAHRQWCTAACRYRTPGWRDVLKPGGRKACVCEVCGTTFTVVVSRPGRFCSRKCLGAANGARQHRDPTKWQTYTCLECGTQFEGMKTLAARKRFCSRPCAALWHIIRRRIARPTGIEIALQAALVAIGITPVREHRMGRFSIDLALPERRIAVEADGDYWHAKPKQRRADARKNAYLASIGWRVLRFTETQINADAAACAVAVAALL